MTQTETIVIRVSPLLKNQIEEMAKKDRRTVSQWIRLKMEDLAEIKHTMTGEGLKVKVDRRGLAK